MELQIVIAYLLDTSGLYFVVVQWFQAYEVWVEGLVEAPRTRCLGGGGGTLLVLNRLFSLAFPIISAISTGHRVLSIIIRVTRAVRDVELFRR